MVKKKKRWGRDREWDVGKGGCGPSMTDDL